MKINEDAIIFIFQRVRVLLERKKFSRHNRAIAHMNSMLVTIGTRSTQTQVK